MNTINDNDCHPAATHVARVTSYSLTARDAAVVKARLLRGDRQSDIAADFRVNQGRIAEISTGKKFADIVPDFAVE